MNNQKIQDELFDAALEMVLDGLHSCYNYPGDRFQKRYVKVAADALRSTWDDSVTTSLGWADRALTRFSV